MPETALDVPDTASFGTSFMPQMPDKPALDVPDATPAVGASPDIFGDIRGKVDKASGALLEAAQTRQGQETFMDRKQNDRIEQDRVQYQRAFQAEGAAADRIPPPWNADREREERIRGPLEQFGSVGSIFAMAASMFTKTPMTSALNAGAAAMKSIQEKDEKGYDSAYKAWLDNTNLAIKRFDMEHTMLADADKLIHTDMQLWAAKRLAIASQFQNTTAITLLQNGMYPELLQAEAAMVKGRADMEKTREGVVEFNQKQEYIRLKDEAFVADHPDAPLTERLQNKIEAVQQANSAQKGMMPRATTDREKWLERMVPEYMKPPEEGGLGLPYGAALKKANDDYKSGGAATMSGENAKTFQSIVQDVKTEHPDWSEGKVRQEAASRQKLSQTVLSKDKLITQEIQRRTQENITAGMGPTEAFDKARTDVMDTAKPTFSDDELKVMAEQYLAGDKTVFQNVRTGGATGYANLVALRKKVLEIARDKNMTGTDIAVRMAEFSGMMAAQRVLGQRTANVEMFNNEALNMMDISLEKSRLVPRSQFVPINRALLSYQRNTGDPAVRAFGASINTLVNTYAKAINGGGQGTVSDKDHAREILEMADTPEQFEAVIAVLRQELEAARKAPGQVKQELRDLATGSSTLPPDAIPKNEKIIQYDSKGNRL